MMKQLSLILRAVAGTVLLLAVLLLSGCRGDGMAEAPGEETSEYTSSDFPEVDLETDSSEVPGTAPDDIAETAPDGEPEKSNEVVAGEETDSAAVSETDGTDNAEPAVLRYLTVVPGEYVTDILDDLADLGYGDAETLLAAMDSAAELLPEDSLYRQALASERASHRTFSAEGYMAPGVYALQPDLAPEELWAELLGSWDEFWNAERRQQAEEQGLTPDEVMTLASIVERESEQDRTDTVKPRVAAVIANRLDQGIYLQMDVTVFYLQEALDPYLDPEEFELWYDTYETAIPAGPIGSPSEASVEAMLNPADTEDLFFIYDKEGNYYFSEDYETHLSYCEQYLD